MELSEDERELMNKFKEQGLSFSVDSVRYFGVRE